MPSVEAVVGRAVRRIRGENGITQDALARAMRALGLKWSPARVRELESGTLRLPLSTVATLIVALRKLAGTKVGLLDLLGSEPVDVIPGKWAMPGQYFVDLLNGGMDIGPVGIAPALTETLLPESIQPAPGLTHDDLQASLRRPASLAEERAARKLDLSLASVRMLALGLWGRPLDEQAAEEADASPQSRGHATRRLTEQMRMAANTDG